MAAQRRLENIIPGTMCPVKSRVFNTRGEKEIDIKKESQDLCHPSDMGEGSQTLEASVGTDQNSCCLHVKHSFQVSLSFFLATLFVACRILVP